MCVRVCLFVCLFVCLLDHWSAYHKYTAAVFVVFCLYLWHLACTVSPGIIDKASVKRFDNYPYDGVLYREGRTCRTTGLPVGKVQVLPVHERQRGEARPLVRG